MHTLYRYTGWIRAAAAVSLVAVLGAWLSAQAKNDDDRDESFKQLRVIGLTDDGRLVRFKAGSPSKTDVIGYVAGLSGTDTALVGIDYRVQDGQLYGVGTGGGVYTLDTSTAVATLINSLTVPLSGAFFGVDFNPAADRLRIVSDTGQNLAHNVNAGGVTAANATLTYTAPPAVPAAALGVTGAAYTNNDVNQAGTGTTLLNIDTTTDQVVIQSPPATGLLVATGKLGFDAGPQVGLDLYSRIEAGVAVANRAFASLAVDGRAGFYRIRPFTGQASLIGRFDEPIVDIALPLNQ